LVQYEYLNTIVNKKWFFQLFGRYEFGDPVRTNEFGSSNFQNEPPRFLNEQGGINGQFLGIVGSVSCKEKNL
jgi:hypothetical protein